MRLNKLLLITAIIFLAVFLFNAIAEPSAPTTINVGSNFTANVSVGALLNTSGGIISTVTINTSTINYKWKGFVGNITGTYGLLDSSLNSLFTWEIATLTGEVYATRNSSLINWANIGCMGNNILSYEQKELNITDSDIDSINRTFSGTTHSQFYVGTTQIAQNTCRAVGLNVNNTIQSSTFQEVLLTDGSNLVYTALIENSTYGFNGNFYDFQIIVAENALEGYQASIPYYFYVELI